MAGNIMERQAVKLEKAKQDKDRQDGGEEEESWRNAGIVVRPATERTGLAVPTGRGDVNVAWLKTTMQLIEQIRRESLDASRQEQQWPDISSVELQYMFEIDSDNQAAESEPATSHDNPDVHVAAQALSALKDRSAVAGGYCAPFPTVTCWMPQLMHGWQVDWVLC